jgi:hypothetical protein
MAFIKTIAPADAEGDVRAMYERQQTAWGFVPNYAKAFCHRPEVMARWGRLLAELKRPMDLRRYELVTFAAAHALRHTACSLAHGKALTAFLDEDEVRRLALGEVSDALSALIRTCAECLARSGGASHHHPFAMPFPISLLQATSVCGRVARRPSRSAKRFRRARRG